jgi:hypothetical protein
LGEEKEKQKNVKNILPGRMELIWAFNPATSFSNARILVFSWASRDCSEDWASSSDGGGGPRREKKEKQKREAERKNRRTLVFLSSEKAVKHGA